MRLFDLLIILGVAPMGFMPEDFRGIYFVWYTILALCASFMTEKVRDFKSKWLGYILLWAFVSVFYHSWAIDKGSICYKYVNFYLMVEGFIYILFGAVLFKTIVEYARDVRLLYVTLPVAAFSWIRDAISGGQASAALAVGVAIFAYLLINRRYAASFLLAIIVAVCAAIKYDWLAMKFACRPYVWIELARQIIEHPFAGTGFNKFFLPDNMVWIRQIGTVTYGWLYRHNDFLSIGGFLGLPILIPIFMFARDLFKRFRGSAYVIPYLAFMMLCCFQLTLFRADKALVIVTATALFYTKTNGRIA